MSNYPLSTIRHSCSHVLAQAILRHYPDAKLGIGPSIDDGFYYDFELEKNLNDDDLVEIENTMKKIIKEKQTFSTYNLDKSKAVDFFNQRTQDYKLEIIDDLNLDEYSFYQNGEFIDLCRGPHVENTRDIKVFKLLKVSGAYWRGSEKNKMLQRIYGTAFENKKDLKDYLDRIKAAKERDHRKLGKELKIFSMNEEVGAGLVLWHPKGGKLRHYLETFWKEEHIKNNYELIITPHIGKSDLWKTSGHLEFYEENMYSSIKIDEQDFYLKPMNCPFHIMIYKAKKWSYRELPVRYAELGTVYRYERSGVMHGLMRVRGFTQDDAHIICTREQVNAEVEEVIAFCQSILTKLGFEKIKIFCLQNLMKNMLVRTKIGRWQRQLC